MSPGTCPDDVPVVALPPQQVAGFSWGPVIRPQNDACVSHIVVDPASDSNWYVGGHSGVYVTKNAGQSWTNPLSGKVNVLALVRTQPEHIYAGISNELFLSTNGGQSWNVIGTFPVPVWSMLFAAGHLYVGLAWSSHNGPNSASGVFASPSAAGGSWSFHSFGPGQTGLIVWTLSYDPLSKILYAGTEIYDHPLTGQPPKYRPPFFRSMNGGLTWTNVNPDAVLQTHATGSAVRPDDGYVYALTEGEGLFGSADHGTNWQHPLPQTPAGPTVGLRMDPQHPKHLFAGQQKTPQPWMKGGIFVSVNAGMTFHPIGLGGVTVAGVALNGTSKRLYAACYASGVYVSPIPASIST
jgi:hypothetical protein